MFFVFKVYCVSTERTQGNVGNIWEVVMLVGPQLLKIRISRKLSNRSSYTKSKLELQCMITYSMI